MKLRHPVKVMAISCLALFLGTVSINAPQGLDVQKLQQSNPEGILVLAAQEEPSVEQEEEELFQKLNEIIKDPSEKPDVRKKAIEKSKSIIMMIKDEKKRNRKANELLKKLDDIIKNPKEPDTLRNEAIDNSNKLILIKKKAVPPPNPKKDPNPNNPNKDKEKEEEKAKQLNLPFIIARDEDTIFVWNPWTGAWGAKLDTKEQVGESIVAVENIGGLVIVRTDKNAWVWNPFTFAWEGPSPTFDKPIVEVKDLSK